MYVCMHVCLPACIYVCYLHVWDFRGQKRMLDSLEIELQGVMNHHIGFMKLGPLQEQ